MSNAEVLQRTINNLVSFNTDAMLVDINYLPQHVAKPIEKAFYEGLKRKGNLRTACRAAKKVAKRYVGKI